MRQVTASESFAAWLEAAIPKLEAMAEVLAVQLGSALDAANRALSDLFNAIPWTEIMAGRAVSLGLATEADIRDVYFADGAWWIRTWNHRRIEVSP